METKLKLDKEDQFFIDLLFDRYQNSSFYHDAAFFEIIDRKKETLYTHNVKKEDVKTNFSRTFLDQFKECVVNSKKVLGYDAVEDNKLSIGPWSVMEFVSGYYAKNKVVDMINNTDDYIKYLEDNKDLYVIEDWINSKFINTREYLPELKSDKLLFHIKSKRVKDDYKIIHPFRRTYGDNLVIFKDFLEDIKYDMKNHYPDAVKVIIRKQGIKRFYGITDLNNEPVYYDNSKTFMYSNESQFEDRTVEWFFIKKDGVPIHLWER